MKLTISLRLSLTLMFLSFCLLVILSIVSLSASSQSTIEPIAFSHLTHSETFAISCRFCHYYADRSSQAGVPSAMDCLGCHHVVKGTEEQQIVEIRKLEHHWLLKQPVAWVKRNDLPDFVFFSHQSHTRIGFLCETCHGEVASQDAFAQSGKIADLTMGWCLDCHTQKHGLTGNGQVVNDLLKDGGEEKPAATFLTGSLECHSCHR